MEKAIPKYVGQGISSLGRKVAQDEIRVSLDAEVGAAYSQRKPVWLSEYDMETVYYAVPIGIKEALLLCTKKIYSVQGVNNG